jgi:hypothetical protein
MELSVINRRRTAVRPNKKDGSGFDRFMLSPFLVLLVFNETSPASVRVLVVWFGKPQLRDKHRFVGVNLWALKDLKRTVRYSSQVSCPRKTVRFISGLSRNTSESWA